MSLKANRKELKEVGCEQCHGTGIEPGTHDRLCSKCMGLQCVNAETCEHFDEFDSVRMAPRLLRRKDKIIQAKEKELSRLKDYMTNLKPFMDAKAAADLQEAIYPTKRKRQRANGGIGGHGD